MKRAIPFFIVSMIIFGSLSVSAQDYTKVDLNDVEGVYQVVISDLHITATDDSPFLITEEEWLHAHALLQRASSEDLTCFNQVIHKMLRSHNMMNNYLGEVLEMENGSALLQEALVLLAENMDEKNATEFLDNVSPSAMQDVYNILAELEEGKRDQFASRIGQGDKDKGLAMMRELMESRSY